MSNLTAEQRVIILQSLWCRERELEQVLKRRIEQGFDDDIIEQYRSDLEKTKELSDNFLNLGV